jgi:hypothetical protein
MGNKESAIYQKAKALAQKAIQGLKDGQKEGSPSKITIQSGKYFGEGYELGIESMIKKVARAARKLVDGAADPLSFGNISGIRNVAAPIRSGAIAGGSSTINNNTYNLVQNNTSPKALTALETYQARRQQVAMVKAMM